MKVMKRVLLLVLFTTMLASGCLGPPFNADARVFYGHQTSPNQSCAADPANSPQYQWYGTCDYHPYPAVDFIIPEGTPIRAAESGYVFIVGDTIEGEDPVLFDCSTARSEGTAETESVEPEPWCRQPDKFVVLDHRRARTRYNTPEFTRYSHLSGFAVNEGQWVRQGTVIGYAGHHHLHFDAFKGLRDNTPTGGFNTYAHQADYGIMEWCDHRGRWRIGGKDTFHRGDLVRMRTC